jgi:hypothetical protein
MPSIPREQPQQQYAQAPQVPKIELPRQERVEYGQQQIKIEAPREQPQQYGQVQAPSISQNSYGQQEQPIIPSIPKELPVQQQYGQVQAPAVSQSSYGQQQQPLPVPVLPREPPIQQQYGQQTQPQLPKAEINNVYGQQLQQPLPVLNKNNYGQERPELLQNPKEQQQPYGQVAQNQRVDRPKQERTDYGQQQIKIEQPQQQYAQDQAPSVSQNGYGQQQPQPIPQAPQTQTVEYGKEKQTEVPQVQQQQQSYGQVELPKQNSVDYRQKQISIEQPGQQYGPTQSPVISQNNYGQQPPIRIDQSDNKQKYFFASTKPTTTTTPLNFYNLWQSDAPTTPKGWTPFSTKEMYKLITTPAPEITSKVQVKIDKYGKANSPLPSGQQKYAQVPQNQKVESPKQDRVDYGQQQIKIEQPSQQYGQNQVPAINQNSYGQQQQQNLLIPKEQQQYNGKAPQTEKAEYGKTKQIDVPQIQLQQQSSYDQVELPKQDRVDYGQIKIEQPQQQVQASAMSQNNYGQQQQQISAIPKSPKKDGQQNGYEQQEQSKIPSISIEQPQYGQVQSPAFGQQQQLPREQPVQQRLL